MKIQPIQIWKNGSLKEAAWLNSYVISDNLKDFASFYYSLSSMNEQNAPLEVLAEGNLVMTGDDYQGWQTNEYAWNWVAGKLSLVLIPDQPVAEI